MSRIRKSDPEVSYVRFRLGLSQQQLADTLGVSRSVIGMVETQKRKLPKAVRDIYRDLCHSANAINPDGDITVKRGRRRIGQSLPTVKIKKISTPINNEPVVDWLQQQKALLSYQHTALQFKKRAAEDRHFNLSIKLIIVNSSLDVSKKVMNKLPEGKLRDKYELSAAVMYAKQVRLKQQLKKCDPVKQLQTELQTKIVERQIIMTEEKIVALKKDSKSPGKISYCLAPLKGYSNLITEYKIADWPHVYFSRRSRWSGDAALGSLIAA